MPSTLSKPSFISFEALVPGSEGVRYTDIRGFPYLSVRDLIMLICGKNGNRANEIWQRLPEHFKNELTAFCGSFQFPGRGQSEQTVITLQGAIKLIMWLPGNMAKDFRSKACDILTRFLAGDQSLHAEIDANATSSAPINEFARASMPESEMAQLAAANAANALLVAVNTQLTANSAQLITTNTQLVATHERTIIVMDQLGSVVSQITNANTAANAALERERHLRHQADGRYGSEIREANQGVRKQARYYEEMANDARAQLNMERKRIKREQQRADEKDKLIGQLVTELMSSRRDNPIA